MTKYTDDFESFWRAWPGRWDKDNQKIDKVGKHEAFIIWRSLTKTDMEVILALVKSGRIKSAGTRYLPDAWKWLAKKRWEDYE